MTHIPVMTPEVLQHLRPEQGGLFVDCTVGLAATPARCSRQARRA